MKKFLCFLIFMCSFNELHANILKVAVIDTGFNLKYVKSVRLCQNDSKDFTGEGLNDINGHGTNIVGLIVDTAKTTNYCIVLIKAYSFKNNHKTYITEALKYAYNVHANIINLSGGGVGALEPERDAVEMLLNAGITLITAAGNEHQDLDENCNYYPACYDPRIYVIGSYSGYSNYGTVVDSIYDGKNKTGFGITLSGTSQSTALFTGFLLKNLALLQQRR